MDTLPFASRKRSPTSTSFAEAERRLAARKTARRRVLLGIDLPLRGPLGLQRRARAPGLLEQGLGELLELGFGARLGQRLQPRAEGVHAAGADAGAGALEAV